MARDKLAGLTPEAEVSVAGALARLEARLAALEVAPKAPETQVANFAVTEGQFVVVEAPPAGITALLPKARAQNRGATITFCFKNTNPVRFIAVGSLVNNLTTVVSTTAGSFDAVSDGATGWFVAQGVTPTGSATGATGATGSHGIQGRRGEEGRRGFPGVSGPVRAPVTHFVTMGGATNNYALPLGFVSGDILAVQLTADATLSGIAHTDPNFSVRLIVHLPDAAPFFTLSLTQLDSNTTTNFNRFLLPGNITTGGAGGTGDPFRMQSPDEWSHLLHTAGGHWRIINSTSAQRVTGDVEIAAGLGGTRTATLTHLGLAKTLGRPGRPGEHGRMGIPGALGAPGRAGERGVPGRGGEDGRRGAPGMAGVAGAAGAAGPAGVGIPGRRGPEGRRAPIVPGPAGAAGSGSGGSSILEVATITLGSVPVLSGTFDISGLSGLTLNAPVGVWLAVNVIDPTESEEQLSIVGYASNTTTITCFWQSVDGTPKAGARDVAYLVASGVTTPAHGWDDVLTVDPTSGANNPNIISGQYLELGSGGTLPGLGDIRGRADLEIVATDDISVVGAPSATLRNGLSTALVVCDGSGVLLNGGSAGDLVDARAAIGLRVSGSSAGTSGGLVRIVEDNAPSTSGTAGEGGVWVQDLAPNALMFTDDVAATWPVNNSCVATLNSVTTATNSTSNITCTSFSVPAGSFRDNTMYKLEGYLVNTRGATATACDLTIEVLLNGTVYSTTTTALFTVAGSGHVLVTGHFRCTGIGAAGTFLANHAAHGDVASAVGYQLVNGTINAASSGTTQDTTAALTLLLRARMSAAVANLSIQWISGSIVRVN